MMAFVQQDLKRLIAYSSVSHKGIVLIGCFALNIYALQGAVMQMLAHGVSTSALFMLVGMIHHRFNTRQLDELGGLWQQVPQLSAIGMFFAVASLGMPGLGNFVAEFLILIGSFQAYPWHTVLAASGLILAAIYSLLIIFKTFFGPKPEQDDPPVKASTEIKDCDRRESATLAMMCVLLIYMGLHPQPILNVVQKQLKQITLDTAKRSQSESQVKPPSQTKEVFL
jgi:NADH-quinone oxidoreductase subunit M